MVDNKLRGNEFTSVLAPVAQTLSTVLGQIDMTKNAAFAGVKRYEITQELPIVQAVLFTLFLALGSIVMVLGRFQINVIFAYYFILCSSVFIPFLIKMVNFLELSIHESMGYGLYSAEQYMMIYSWFTNFYFAIPLVYLTLMSLCGIQAGNAVSGFMGSSISTGGVGVVGAAVKAIAKV